MDLNTGTITVSLNHTLPIPWYYSAHKVFKSYVKSSQANLLYSSALLVSIRVLPPRLFLPVLNCDSHYPHSELLISITQLKPAHLKSLILTFRSSSTTNVPRLSPTENPLKLNAISPINQWTDTRIPIVLLMLRSHPFRVFTAVA
jgi:hypothetical protein